MCTSTTCCMLFCFHNRMYLSLLHNFHENMKMCAKGIVLNVQNWWCNTCLKKCLQFTYWNSCVTIILYSRQIMWIEYEQIWFFVPSKKVLPHKIPSWGRQLGIPFLGFYWCQNKKAWHKQLFRSANEIKNQKLQEQE